MFLIPLEKDLDVKVKKIIGKVADKNRISLFGLNFKSCWKRVKVTNYSCVYFERDSDHSDDEIVGNKAKGHISKLVF